VHFGGGKSSIQWCLLFNGKFQMMAAKKLATIARPQSFPKTKKTGTEAPPLVSIEQLRDENEALRTQHAEMHKMLNQLLSEDGRENYSQRRVMLLKAQLFQTERQLMLSQDGMARRTAALWEAENVLQAVKKQLQSLANDPSSSSSHVSVPRSDLFRLIEGVEKARSALFRRLDSGSVGGQNDSLTALTQNRSSTGRPNRFMYDLNRPSFISNRFSLAKSLNGSIEDTIDVLTWRNPGLNFKKVSNLESETFACYEKVVHLEAKLTAMCGMRTEKTATTTSATESDDIGLSAIFSPEFLNNLHISSVATRASLASLGNSLLDLSILVPLSDNPSPSCSIKGQTSASPAPSPTAASPFNDSPCNASPTAVSPTNNSSSHLPSTATVLSKFPRQSIAKSHYKEVSSIISALLHVAETQRKAKDARNAALQAELQYYCNLFEAQNKFINDVIGTVRSAYDEFWSRLDSAFSSPLSAILDSFLAVKGEATEENLRLFLLQFRHNEDAFTRLLSNLHSGPQKSSSGSAFESLRQSFEMQMVTGLRKLREDRDKRREETQEVEEAMRNVSLSFEGAGV